MLISDHYRNCVVFLSQEGEGGAQIPKGTAFMVADPATDGEKVDVVHLVTAANATDSAYESGHRSEPVSACR